MLIGLFTIITDFILIAMECFEKNSFFIFLSLFQQQKAPLFKD